MRYCSLVLCMLLLSVSCKKPVQYPEGKENKSSPGATESLVNINKYLVKRQQEIISSYVQRTGLQMQKSRTGLWYMIYEKGSGKQAETGNIITLEYSVTLLDGTLCDASVPGSPKSFRIGHGGVEPGLEEGVQLLKEGDRAKFIMAPYLAHGNIVNHDKIPAGEILVYDVFVISVK